MLRDIIRRGIILRVAPHILRVRTLVDADIVDEHRRGELHRAEVDGLPVRYSTSTQNKMSTITITKKEKSGENVLEIPRFIMRACRPRNHNQHNPSLHYLTNKKPKEITHHRLLRNQPIPNPTPPVALISCDSRRAHPCGRRAVGHPGDEPFVALGWVRPVFEA